MKRLMKFGVILMALAVALAGCRTATGSSEVKEMTVNVGITNGTTALKAPVAIKGADFNAIKAKLVAELGLSADKRFEKDDVTYAVTIDKFYSEAAATADKEVQAEAIKDNDTIYVIALMIIPTDHL
jgi:lipoprotein